MLIGAYNHLYEFDLNETRAMPTTRINVSEEDERSEYRGVKSVGSYWNHFLVSENYTRVYHRGNSTLRSKRVVMPASSAGELETTNSLYCNIYCSWLMTSEEHMWSFVHNFVYLGAGEQHTPLLL